MESKRKIRKVHKAVSETPERVKSPKPPTVDSKPSSAEVLIRLNGELVESLYLSPVWTEIIQPLLLESVASVSGRLTNGRWYYGADSKASEDLQYLRGYKTALMDFQNRLNDFTLAKDRLIQKKKSEEEEKTAPIYNPFLEEEDNG